MYPTSSNSQSQSSEYVQSSHRRSSSHSASHTASSGVYPVHHSQATYDPSVAQVYPYPGDTLHAHSFAAAPTSQAAYHPSLSAHRRPTQPQPNYSLAQPPSTTDPFFPQYTPSYVIPDTQPNFFVPTPSQTAQNYMDQPLAPPSRPRQPSNPYQSNSSSKYTPRNAPLVGPAYGSLSPQLSPSSDLHSPTVSSPTGERYVCQHCGTTFSRSHDRRRHYETHHMPSPAVHRCPHCVKDFSRGDSLKRHIDNGCEEAPRKS
ncbi:hypothetical protein PLICRDRAFT_172740 [Plicaturopsis crispa FD-325 SS-3]|nr:hypothetical protein PLICRDRAFT_172740 [Plicaturopsis crispa FD-325 SS-3]